MSRAASLLVAPSFLRKVTIALGGVIAGAGLVAELFYAFKPGRTTEVAVAFLSLSYEQNLPTWYSSTALLIAALLVADVAADAGATHDRWRWHWRGLAAGFAFMSLDESVELHENLALLYDGGGLLYFGWVVPATAALVVLAALFVPFLKALPMPTRRRCVVAGAIYLVGAVLMELPLGWWTERAGTDNLTYALIDWLEESLELAGVSLFIVVMATYRLEGRGQA